MIFLKRLCLVLLSATIFTSHADPIVVGSKNFPESYILAELMAQLLESSGIEVERRFNLAGTKVCFDALKAAEIDVYPEYSGTVQTVILNSADSMTMEELNTALELDRVEFLEPFGFNNSYALAVRRQVAEGLNLTTISDLVLHPELNVSVTHEFIERPDGWPWLQQVYGFSWTPDAGIEHSLAYRALADGSIDVTDAYTTDGEIARYGLVLLEDDKQAFPHYYAAPISRSDLDPEIKAILNVPSRSLNDAAMTKLNASVMFNDVSYEEAAAEHLKSIEIYVAPVESSMWRDLGRATVDHLILTVVAMIAAIVVGLGVSLVVFRYTVVARVVVYSSGLMQTIPSLALLALMIPFLGTGMVPAIAALFLYSLLPIIRNSVTALSTVDPVLLRVAEGMGFTRTQLLRYIYVPLSIPAIIAGIRISAVICIGTATLAAFIGAGGLGQFIVQGLALNDTGLILQGAIAASVLAIIAELLFEQIEKIAIPKHLRVSS